MLELYYDGVKIDELCWGKISCANQIAKFSTKPDDNYSALRIENSFESAKYYPAIRADAIEIPPAPPSDCEQLRFSELLSYYSDSSDEQFVELYNPTDTAINLGSCSLIYKKKIYPLSGMIAAHAFYAHRGIVLTKNPSSSAEISIGDTAGNIYTSLKHPHGQRKNTSYALFDDDN